MGQQVSPDAERELPMLRNSRVDNYVDDLGRKLASEAQGEKYPYKFKVVNDPAASRSRADRSTSIAAPERDFQGCEDAFREMLRSVRIKR